MKTPLILDIKGNSLDDGPGIRSVVFFKGCPLNCTWCQNPESQRTTAELSWDKEKCIGCGACVESCPEIALSENNPFFIDRDLCNACFKCVDVCPSNALQQIGKIMDVEEVIQEVLRYKSFFETSGGGVTLSGGEPTLFMDFSAILLKRLKGEGIHTLLETCGFFEMDRFEKVLLPWVDTVYMDIKIIDQADHKKYCGVSNVLILNNFLKLNQLAASGKISLLPRTPLIPNITDRRNSISELIWFYQTHMIKKAALLENNPIWINKCSQLGYCPEVKLSSELRDFYDPEKLDAIKTLFIEQGIKIVVSSCN